MAVVSASSLPAASIEAVPHTRKRTSSFSFPSPTPLTMVPTARPTKAAKLSNGLRRTASFLDMDDAAPSERKRTARSSSQLSSLPAPPTSPPPNPPPSPKNISRSKSIRKSSLSLGGVDPATALVPKPTSLIPNPTPFSRSTTPSPLIPTDTQFPNPVPATPIFSSKPTSRKPKPTIDLHRKAVTTCMLRSPEGQRFLHMGRRLVWSITTATRELEKIVASACAVDTCGPSSQDDFVMADAALASVSSSGAGLTSSWVVVPGDTTTTTNCDWEMISCN